MTHASGPAIRSLRIFALIPLALYWVMLGFLTHLPPRALPNVGVNDKVAHTLAFSMLASLLYLTFWTVRPAGRGFWWKILLVILVYGALDEWTQPLTHRDCDIRDWICDGTGAAVAVAMLTLLRMVIQRRHRQWQAAFERAVRFAQTRDERQPPQGT